jgi:ribonuclease P protein component
MPTVREITRFTKQEIKNLFAHARRQYRSPELDILVAPACQNFGKILVVTPARIGSAPQRNTIRRRIKSIFYQEKLFELGFTCIVLAKAHSPSLSFDILKHALIKALSKHKIVA